MEPVNPKATSDLPAFAVAQRPERAQQLAEALRSAGFLAKPETDLESVLAGDARLVVVDPQGWEASCEACLGAYDRRPRCPPAVLFVSWEPLVQYTAGPAFRFLPEPVAGHELAAAAKSALRARQRFCAVWPTPLGVPPDRDLKRLAAALERATGLEVRRDRQAAFIQALRTRFSARLMPSPHEYGDLLDRHPEGAQELEALAGLITVGETYFWRYSGQFRALQTELLPALGRRWRSPRRLRLWSAGCASGEEAYSLAMACAQNRELEWDVEVVATDLHRGSLARAERAEYRPRSLRNLPSVLARRYMVPISGGARVADEIRRRVRFEFVNLGSGRLASWARERGPFDAIFCRNTLIYFSDPAVQRTLGVFEDALAEGGGLFLGAAEALHSRRPTLRPVRGPGSFFYVKETPAPVAPAPAPQAPTGPGSSPESSVDALYARGLGLLDAEEFEGAREAFRSIIALAPEDARGHTGLSLLLANDGRETEARRHLEKGRRMGPELAETHYLLGLLEERAGCEAEALRHYRRALDIDPEFFMAHFNRAWILRRRGKTEAFAEELRRVRAILLENPRANPWITGGLGLETLLDLVGTALEGAEAQP